MRALRFSSLWIVFMAAACGNGSNGIPGHGGATASTSDNPGSGGTAGVITLVPLGTQALTPAEQTGNPDAVVLASGQAEPVVLALDHANLTWFNLGSNPQLEQPRGPRRG